MQGKSRFVIAPIATLITAFLCLATTKASAQSVNLIQNGDFEQKAADGSPLGYQLQGDVEYRYLGDEKHVASSHGIALESAKRVGSSGSVSQTVSGIDPAQGRWFRFTLRGLPQANFHVTDDDLFMKVEFFGQSGKVSYDEKARHLFNIVQQARKDLGVNGKFNIGGAEVWRTYQMDFYLPFPQVDQLRLSVGFGHGAASKPIVADFFVDDFSLVRIPEPAGTVNPATQPAAIVPEGKMLPLGGRWFYVAKAGESTAPKLFDHTNADRLVYHDAIYSAPFSGNTSAWLHAGNMDLSGQIVKQDRLVADNVTISFDATSMIIHTHGLPNHPTGRFPAEDSSSDPNPNYIQEKDATYYIPLNPTPNPKHVATAKDNSNHALPMGPIGVAVNGVVFFNPFDAGSQDATNLMDLCCGHPSPDYTYHYHKYPICLNSLWADEGKEHSPLIGWAFDGYPVYGPYASANVMAKDVTGENALNEFNIHFDADRGWHYQVTPGKFPYIIGGYWGTEDSRDVHRGPPGGGRRGGPSGGGPPSF